MPGSWVSVLIFICFVAPGFYYEQISRTRRVRAKESTFQEVSRTVLGSVSISVPAGLAAFGVWLLVTDSHQPDFSALLRGDNAYIGTHFGSVLAALVGYLFASVLIARLVNNLFASVLIARLVKHLFVRRGTATLVSAHTLWTELFNVRKGPNREAAVRVVMKSGHTWSGIVGSFSADHETDDRELVLYRPILFSASPETPPVLQLQDVVVLTGGEISSIGINYTAKEENAALTEQESARAQVA